VVEIGETSTVSDLAISLNSLSEARNFMLKLDRTLTHYTQCYANQSRASHKHQANAKMARLYLSHFIQVLNLSVLREEIKPSQKQLYGLPEANVVPDLLSESALAEWGEKVIKGEQERVARGGIPIYNPTIARVKVHYDIFMESYGRQKNLQLLTSRSLEALAALREPADKLILDIWNQVEARFQNVQPNERRLELCRSYGLVYYYRNNEKTS
jgi:hypothetical protein